jgi:hypothetical protein
MMSAVPAEAHEDWPEWRRKAPRHYEFKDKAGIDKTFDGWLVSSESTEADRSVRWTEIEVYLTVTGKYIVRTLGRSVIYHKRTQDGVTGCNTGRVQIGQDMDEDMLPCRKCRPPAAYASPEHDNTLFDVEVDIPTITHNLSAKGVITALHWRGNDQEPESISYVASRLLEKLRERDPAIDAELSKPVSLN